MTTTNGLDPRAMLAAMLREGITHVVWLPDSETNWLFELMRAEASLTLVGVAREGLAFSVAAGLHAGGAKPVIMIQNTGLLESGDSLRGWGLGLDLPVVMVVGYRGWSRSGKPTDTAAGYTEPVLDAFGIRHWLVAGNEDMACIGEAFAESRRRSQPVAVLVGEEYQGARA